MASSLGLVGAKRTYAPRRPRILLATCGSSDALKFGTLCRAFLEWADVKVVVTKAALRFIDRASFPNDAYVYWDDSEWHSWKRIGDNVLHIELSDWADIMVIAPLSANTLAKIAQGLCDNLLTCIVRAWDFDKPMFVAPSMNSCMWENLSTEEHCMTIDDELGIFLIRPLLRMSATGYETRVMPHPSIISLQVMDFYELKILKS